MRHTLNDSIRKTKPCRECRASEGGLWAVDQATGEVQYGKRCHCHRGRLLAKADAIRAKSRDLVGEAA